MASRATFDPNDGQSLSAAAWKNRAVAWSYEPGSTFKPFVVAGALAKGVLNRQEQIDCGQGETRLGGRVLHDTHAYGQLSVADVLVKSSNIGMAQIGAQTFQRAAPWDPSRLWFRPSDGSALPGEMAGMLRPVKEWSSYSKASLSMGQEVTVTPLQMITAHAALANGGVWISPEFVLSVARGGSQTSQWPGPGPQGHVDGEALERGLPPSVVSQATDPAVARWLIEEPMTEVVRRGTGQRAQLPGYRVFGKTGTAQKLDRTTGTYSATKYVGSFFAGHPPAIRGSSCLVVVDEPSTNGSHYGGTVAAPSAAKILWETLVHLHVPARRPLDRWLAHCSNGRAGTLNWNAVCVAT